MSVQAMSWVLDHSESELAARLVLLAIANHCDSVGRNAWPSQEKIADEAHVSVRTVKRCVVALSEMGELTVGNRQGAAVGRARTNYYELPLFIASLDEGTSATEGQSVTPDEVPNDADEGTSDAGRGDISGDEGPTVAPQEPSLRTVQEPSVEPSSRGHREPTFADCWNIYPRKLARKKAEKAWTARIRSGCAAQQLYDATVHYAKHRAGQDGSYTMHGSTFYGPDDRWLDFLDPSTAVPPVGKPKESQAMSKGRRAAEAAAALRDQPKELSA